LGKEVPEDKFKQFEKDVNGSLRQLNDIWLNKAPYLAGDEISIADLICYGELIQLSTLRYDFKSQEKVYSWMKRMENLQGYDEVHSILKKVVAKL
jgi:glutathione S-transferase